VQKGFTPEPFIPKTPGVSALERFLDMPVSLHTGVHDVTIPVFQIPMKNFSIPIALKYNSSGIRVEDVATDVGLGWSLQAGGVVSSTVHGLPDSEGDWPNDRFNRIHDGLVTNYLPFIVSTAVYESNEDPLNLYTDLNTVQPNPYSESAKDLEFLKGVIRGARDSEPDVFFFSTPTISGKFYRDLVGYRPIPYQKVKIETIEGGEGFKITDESGNVFEFSEVESSGTSSVNDCTGIGTSPYPSSYAHKSYHLAKIITAQNEVVNFIYAAYEYGMTNQRQWNREGPDFNVDADCQLFIPFVTGENCQSHGSTGFQAKMLVGITTSNGYNVSFAYDSVTRTDLPGAHALTGITVKNHLDQMLKDFSLQQSYTFAGGSTTDQNNYRLRLNAAGETGKPLYTFEYDDTYQLPNRLSLSVDHYGYFNGVSNSTLLPREEQYGFDTGADREPNFAYAKTGILTKLNYPTGGYLTFEYEPHKYHSSGEIVYNKMTKGVTSSADQTITGTFTMPDNALNQRFFWENSDFGTDLEDD
jgi:hypothetical protein